MEKKRNTYCKDDVLIAKHKKRKYIPSLIQSTKECFEKKYIVSRIKANNPQYKLLPYAGTVV